MKLHKFAASEGQAGTNSETDKEKELRIEGEKAKAQNDTRSGKGTRIRVGQTRGKSPKVISWEAFDTDQPATLPVSLGEFMELSKVNDEPVIVSYLIDGFNSAQYAAASDILSEYTEPNWPDALVKQFKQTVNNYSAATGVSLEDAVALIKPGIVKAFAARLAAESKQ